MPVREPEPIDFRFIQMVCEYLERVQDSIRTKPEPAHMRLLSPRKSLVSDAVAEVISATASRWEVDDSAIAPWQWASVVLWARELVELEVRSVSGTHVDSDYARAVRVAGHVARPLPHRVHLLQPAHNEKSTYP